MNRKLYEAQRRAELDSLEAKRAGLKKQLAIINDALRATHLDDDTRARLRESAETLQRKINSLPDGGAVQKLERLEAAMNAPGISREEMLDLIAEREVLLQDLNQELK
jgi:hypothetical protein